MIKYLTAIVAGVAIGFSLAPDKGANTRRRITQFFTGIPDKVDKQLNKAVQKVENAASAVDQKIVGFGGMDS